MLCFLKTLLVEHIEWIISPILFTVTLIVALVLTILLYFFKCIKKITITPTNILFVGTFISAMSFFMPIYMNELTTFQAVMNSIQHAFRLFALDGDIFEKVIAFENYPDEIKSFYISFGSFLYTFAPLLTFGFILSFFKNLWAYIKYNICFWAKTHVFSELSEKTLALATALVENDKNKPILGFIPKILIVFTDIVDKKEELSLELIEDAKRMGAILFRKDLESVHFKKAFQNEK